MSDNMGHEKRAGFENALEENDAGGVAMEILRELKEHNKRIHDYNKRLIITINAISISFSVAVAVIISAFLIYLYQYDFQSYSQDGGYNNINTGTQGDVNNGTEIPGTQEEGRQGQGDGYAEN